MKLVPSLLQKLVSADAEAIYVDGGEVPYVVAGTRVDFCSEPVTAEAVHEIVAELLPPESQGTFRQSRTARCELPQFPGFPGERFSLVAVRVGRQLCVEIRRDRAGERTRAAERLESASLPEEKPTPLDAPADLPLLEAVRVHQPDAAPLPPPDAGDFLTDWSPAPLGDPLDLELPGADELWPGQKRIPPFDSAAPPSDDLVDALDTPCDEVPRRRRSTRHAPRPDVASPGDLTTSIPMPAASGLVRFLRLAAGRGASELYLTSGAQPAIRLDGETQFLEGPRLVGDEIESLLIASMPASFHDRVRSGRRMEWLSEVPGVGAVRSVSQGDRRGATGLFHIRPARVLSAQDLGLPPEVQALALEREGLVLLAAPRSGGKASLMAAFIDLINRTRRAHIITIETEIQIVHDVHGCVISQREVRGGDRERLAAVRAALRDDPDVLAIDDLSSDEILQLALKAAAAGRLVIGGLPEQSIAGVVECVLDAYPADRRRRAQAVLAETLRGIVAQVLLRKSGGGVVAAREILLNTPQVGRLIADGDTSHLPEAIEAGRPAGMVSLDEALAELVRGGVIDLHDAYRRAADRHALLAYLEREGVDISVLEPLA